MPFIDIHTHGEERPGVLSIRNHHWGADVGHFSGLRSVGLHPWHLAGFPGNADAWLRDQLAFPGVVAVGECGLDRLTASPLPTQQAAFELCVLLSETFSRPLIIHCVRMHQEILEVRRRCGATQKWVFHGFVNNRRLAEQCVEAGCHVSLGAALLRTDLQTVWEVCRFLPADRFFLETDTSDSCIEAIYRAAAAIRCVGEDELRWTIHQNFLTLFPNRVQH
jgi:TatD DNase family protein